MRWTLDDINFNKIDKDKVNKDELLFYLITSASFIEYAADVYTKNLIEYYGDNAEATEWLANHWEKEEIQHGKALTAYVKAAWPEFDWDAAYEGFFKDYSAACTMDEFEPGAAREMAARCVVETGTSTFYEMINQYTEEPVLQQLTHNIKKDEINHYRTFRDLFLHYNKVEKNGRISLIKTLVYRVTEAENDDTLYAYKHIYAICHPGKSYDRKLHADYIRRTNQFIFRPFFPYKMGARMLLSLLNLNGIARKLAEPTIVFTARLFAFR